MDQREVDEAEWTNPDNWRGPKWAAVYFSKRDSRVWVPKRIPALGWTVNFGRRGGVAWMHILTLGIPLIVLAICLLTSLLR